MPMGKYYCDYCDKQFQDTPFARKRHLQSLSHQRSKALWFDSFKEPNQGFPFVKGVCNRFLRTGFCQYGDSCKYFHPNNSHHSSFPENNNQPPPPNTPINQFIQGGSTSFTGVGSSSSGSWGNLPPSLMPPPEGGYPPLPFLDWG